MAEQCGDIAQMMARFHLFLPFLYRKTTNVAVQFRWNTDVGTK
jgi:hypothetical protein